MSEHENLEQLYSEATTIPPEHDPRGKFAHINYDTGALEWTAVEGGTGKSTETIINYYIATETEVTPTRPTAAEDPEELGWSKNKIPTNYGVQYPFLWGYDHTIFSDSTVHQSPVALKGRYAEDGKSISEILVYWQANASSEPPACDYPSSENNWTTFAEAQANFNDTNKYFWREEITVYSPDGSTSSWRISLSTYGSKGDKGDTGDSGYIIDIGNDYISIPCDYNGVIPEHTTDWWQNKTTHTIKVFYNTKQISFKVTNDESVAKAAKEAYIYYNPISVTFVAPEAAESYTEYKPYISALSDDAGRIEYKLYRYDATQDKNIEAANGTFKASKLKQGDPLLDHWITPSCTAIKISKAGTRVPNDENITFTATQQYGSEESATFVGWWEYKIDGAETWTCKSSEILEIANTFIEGVEVRLYNKQTGSTEDPKVLYDSETISVVRDGTDGSDAFAIHVENEFVSIPCKADGTVIESLISWETDTKHIVSATKGTTSISFIVSNTVPTVGTVTKYVIVPSATGVTPAAGTTTEAAYNYENYITAINADNGRIIYNLYDSINENPIATFNFNAIKNRKGESVGKIWIAANTEKIKIDKNGNRTPSGNIEFKFYQKIGEDATKPFSGYYTWTKDDVAQTAATGTSLTVTNDALKGINVQLYDEEGGTLYDTETVTVLEDGKDGTSAYNISISKPFDLVPCDASGNPTYASETIWKQETLHEITCYLGTTEIVVDGGLTNVIPTSETTAEYTLVYSISGITNYVPNTGEISGNTFKPYITGISADSGKVTYTLYEKATAKAQNIFVASKNKQGEPGEDYYITQSVNIIKVDPNDNTKVPDKETGITFSFYKKIGTADPELYKTGYYTITYNNSTEGAATESATGTLTITGDDFERITLNVIVKLYNNISKTNLLGMASASLLTDGKDGGAGEKGDTGDPGDESISKTIYAAASKVSGKTYQDLVPAFPEAPVTDDSGTWKLTKPTCESGNDYIYSAIESYQMTYDKDQEKYVYKANSLSFSKADLLEAYKMDVDPIEYATFIKLTKEGTQKNIYYGDPSAAGHEGEDAKSVYINADYIKTGTMEANRILGGTLKLGVTGDNPGELKIYDGNGTEESNIIGSWTKDGISINKGSIQLGTASSSGEYPFSVTDEGELHSTSGTIGGFTIGNTDLHNGDFSAASSIWLSTGKTSSTSIGGSSGEQTWAITAGNKFGVTTSGDLYGSNVKLSGNITATSGTIGNCTINEDGELRVPVAYIDGTITANGIIVRKTDEETSDILFKAISDEHIVTIAKFTVNESSIYTTGKTFGTDGYVLLSSGLSSDTSIGGSSGTQTWALASSNKFGVTTSGNLYANGANITGAITCNKLTADTEGTIGGWTIGSSTLTGGSTILNSNGTITCSTLIANTQGNIGGFTISGSSLSYNTDSATITLGTSGITIGKWKTENTFDISSSGEANKLIFKSGSYDTIKKEANGGFIQFNKNAGSGASDNPYYCILDCDGIKQGEINDKGRSEDTTFTPWRTIMGCIPRFG